MKFGWARGAAARTSEQLRARLRKDLGPPRTCMGSGQKVVYTVCATIDDLIRTDKQLGSGHAHAMGPIACMIFVQHTDQERAS